MMIKTKHEKRRRREHETNAVCRKRVCDCLLYFFLPTKKARKYAFTSSFTFQDWKEARRFAGPLPFTFSFDAHRNEVLIIEGVRENWTPQPIEVNHYDIHFLEEMGFKNAILANAFQIENIPYYWKKGKIETWKKKE